MAVDEVMAAVLSVEWLLGASMVLAFRKSVVGFIQAKVFGKDNDTDGGGR